MQHRALALTAAVLISTAAVAQCPGTGAGLVSWDTAFGFGSTFAAADEGLSSPPIALPFAFPMPGAVGTLDQLWVTSNGELYLTDSTLGLSQPNDGDSYGYASFPAMQGAAGGSARIAVCSRDHDRSFVAGANWSVTVDLTFAGEVRVIWTDVARWNNLTDRYGFQCTLFASGLIRLDYTTSVPAATTWVGVSVGNLEPSASGSQDLTTLPTSAPTNGILYQSFTAATWDLSGQSVLIAPDPTPGVENYSVQAVIPFPQGPCASHGAYGTGCYGIARDTFYQFFPDAAVASPALQGNSMTLNPVGNGYMATWNAGGASGYVAPVTPTDLPRSDDGQEVLDLTLAGLSPLPVPGGSTTTLYVHMNGFVATTGPTNQFGNWNTPPNDWTPSTQFRNAPETAFWSWHDFQPDDLAGGPVRWHHDAALDVLYITWDGVENRSTPVANNPSTIQFQLHLAGSTTPGRVVYVWSSVDTATTSLDSTAYLVGYSPGGTSLDPGSIPLASALPVVTQPEIFAMQLSAAPRPVINPSTAVTYAASNLPEFVPGSGVYLSTMFLSVNPNPGGFDLLGILTNTPGCKAWILTLDLDLGGQLTFAPTANWNFTFSNAFFAPGNVIAAQAIALFDSSFPLANGENGGFVVSNGVLSTTQLQ